MYADWWVTVEMEFGVVAGGLNDGAEVAAVFCCKLVTEGTEPHGIGNVPISHSVISYPLENDDRRFPGSTAW